MQVKKFAKWGLALTSTLVLGGVVGPVGGQLLNTTDVVYAQEVLYYKVQHMTWDLDNTYKIVSEETLPIYPGETKTISSHAKVMDGEWVYDVSLEYDNDFTYDEVASGFRGIVVVMYTRPDNYNSEQPTETSVETPTEQPAEKPADKPVEQPTEKPAEQPVEIPAEKPVEKPTEKPVETPTEQPITYRIHYFLNDVAENGGTPSYTDIAPYKEGVIAKGETIVEVAPHIDGYAVAGNNTISVTYDHVAGDNVWHDEDWYPTSYFFYDKVDVPKPAETPTEKTVETPPAETKPVETPAEKPAEQPVDTPTDKPVEQLTAASSLTDQAAGKAQPVATTDKKKVDTSTPSTSPVASQDTAKTTAKSLPKTGDSGSMLLVLGGFLSGLSGLGLAATSRKKD